VKADVKLVRLDVLRRGSAPRADTGDLELSRARHLGAFLDVVVAVGLHRLLSDVIDLFAQSL
jgi:hypothetical protein